MKALNLKDDSGQTMILTLLCMTILLGFVGFAADIGIMFRNKRNLQIAADAAAVAGAAELNYGNWSAAGQAAATQNGVTNGAGGAVVTINNPPLYGAYAGVANNVSYVEAIVTQNQPTFFAQLFNLFSINVAARAVATLGPAGCIYTLATAGTGLTFSGMTVSLPTCAIVDNSSTAAALAANSGVVTASQIGAVGGYANGGATVTPTPITGIAPVSDPLAYLTPPAFNAGSCMADPGPTPPSPLTPGCYNGLTIGGAGTVVLNPGIYVINGALTIPAAATPIINGNGVTFYFPNMTALLSDGGSETWNVTAPTAAPGGGGAYYNGMLFYQDPSDTNPLIFTSAQNSTLEGIIYAPTAAVTINGDPTATLYESVDAASLTLAGTGTLQNYNTINNASVLSAAKLVE